MPELRINPEYLSLSKEKTLDIDKEGKVSKIGWQNLVFNKKLNNKIKNN